MSAPPTPRPITVLLVEDNPGDARLILELLRDVTVGEFALERVDRLEPALERLKHAGVDAVLLDLGLPDSEGIETFSRAHLEAPGKPIVVISGLDDERVALEAVQLGAQDYLVKGRIEGQLLARVIQYAIERKRVEHDLAKREEWFRALVEHSWDATSVFGSDGTILYGGPATTRVLGYSAHELIGMSVFELIHPDSRASFAAPLEESLRRPEAQIPFQASVLHKGGSWRILEGVLTNLLDQPGVGGIVNNFRDITERKRAEELIRWLSTAVDQSPTSIIMTDASGNIEYVNAKFTEVTGYTPEEVRGKSPSFLKSGQTPPAIYQDLWTTISAGRPWQGEILNRTKGGALYWDAMWIYPIRVDREVTRYLAIKENITERKQTEEILAERVRLAALAADVGLALTQATSLREVLQQCAEAAVKHLGAAFARIWTLNEATQTLELQASAGMYTHLDGPHARVPLGQFKIGRIAQERRPHLTNAVQGDPLVHDQEWARREGMVAFAGHPLIVEDRVVGVFAIFARRVLPEATLQALGSVADEIALGLERKRSEEALRWSEQRFRQLTENIQEVFFVMDAQYRETLYISPAYEQLWGRSCQSLYNRPSSFLEAVQPEDRDRLIAYIAQVQQGDDPGEIEYRVIRPDGTVRSVLSRAVPIRDERGEVYRIAGTALDITDSKRAEDALRESERRARTLFETVHLIVLGLDSQGRVEYVNPFFLQLTGYSREEVLGQPWIERFLPETQRSEMRAVFTELLEQEFHPHYQNSILTKSGEERTIKWNNTVLRDVQGQPVGTLSIGEDITEHNRLEDQFRQSQKMEAVGRLAGGVAHDFNNVLTAILGYADMLLEDLAPGDRRQDDITEIRTAAQRAAGLTRQLLAFSRQQILQPTVLKVNDVVTNLEKMLRRLLGEDVELRTGLAADTGNVHADAGQLEQVLMNLAVNARDAMPTGGKLTIATANADLGKDYKMGHQAVIPGPYVLLAVSDTGQGMSPAIVSRIFEPFFTTKELGQGTGLGLSTVYGIVKQSNGYIWVYSEPGAGTTFKVYLPRVDAPVDAPSPARELQRSLTGTETILLAEDDEQLRRLACGLLERFGYTVLAAASTEEALALAREHRDPIHLLLTDVVMPGESGRRLATRLADLRPETRVLYMSGYTDAAIVHHGVLEPGLNYLQKPFAPAALGRRIRDVLDPK